MIELMLLVFFLALVYEIVDSSLGQGYGTLGTPTFMLLGFSSKLIVPAVLISQACGGLVATFRHHHHGNADFSHMKTDDFKRMLVIAGFGITGVIVASVVGIKISKDVMSLYIGAMVTLIGILVLSGVVLKYGWKKLAAIGLVSAFNKGLSGGGYGPLVAGGQAVVGVGHKAAVAITDFAEVPICLVGFATWTAMGGALDWNLIIPMCLGAAIAPLIGCYITFKTPKKKFRPILGAVLLVLGILSLAKVLNP